MLKSWNHILTSGVREYPIALHIETKAPTKSWTDGRPQIAIWTGAWIRRLLELRPVPDKRSTDRPIPATPILIVQGHDWHLLILQKELNRTLIWEKIDVGNTRSVFAACQVLAVLHWLAHWADTTFKSWLEGLVSVPVEGAPSSGLKGHVE